jgi:hypothetical protein
VDARIPSRAAIASVAAVFVVAASICGCAARAQLELTGPPPPPVATAAPVVPAVCATPWNVAPKSSGPLPREVLVRALRPAVAAAQFRLCDCLAHADPGPRVVRFKLRTNPDHGRASVTAVVDPPAPALSACLAGIETTYTRFPVGSDCVNCGGEMDEGVVIYYPLAVDLRAPSP